MSFLTKCFTDSGSRDPALCVILIDSETRRSHSVAVTATEPYVDDAGNSMSIHNGSLIWRTGPSTEISCRHNGSSLKCGPNNSGELGMGL